MERMSPQTMPTSETANTEMSRDIQLRYAAVMTSKEQASSSQREVNIEQVKNAGSNAVPVSDVSRELISAQKAYGNQAVLRTLRQSQPIIQAQLAVNQPGDVYEQEADRVADQVMRMPAPVAVQRRCAGCEQEERLQRKCEYRAEEEKTIQRKEAGAGPEIVPPLVHEVLHSPGRPLDPVVRAFMEPRFGYDFSHVRIGQDARAASSARAVNALAYTVGHNVIFGDGQYSPATAEGKRLLAHELTHVIQQRSNREGRQAAVHSGATVSAETSPQLQRQPSPQAPAASSPPCPFPSDFPDQRSAQMDMMCISNTSTNPSCTLTAKHLQLLTAAQAAARQRVQRAHFRMFAVGGPEFAERVGRKVFTDGPPSKAVIVKTLEALEKILLGQITFAGGTCADPECESGNLHAAAYESGPGNPVVFCPRSFLPDFLPELRRSVLHEAVHLSGIDIDPNVTERYCMSFTCDSACQSTASADAWTLFVDCIGGPLPNK
jgi:hypothetical protein